MESDKPKKEADSSPVESILRSAGFTEESFKEEFLSELKSAMGFEKTPENPEETRVQEARDALRRYTARDMDKVYISASKRIGKELEYASASHMVRGFVGFLVDAGYTLWGPIERAVQSPLVKAMVKKMVGEEVGEGKTLVDLFLSKAGEGKSEEERNKTRTDLEKPLEAIKRQGRHAKNLADYCQETGKSPDSVLKFAKNRMKIIEKTFGSIREYERTTTESLKNILSKLNAYLDKLEVTQPEQIIYKITSYKPKKSGESILGREEASLVLNALGLEPAMLGSIAKGYLTDAAKFSIAFFEECAKQTAREIEQYRALKAQARKTR